MTTNKETFNITYATIDSVGDWEGEEQKAVENFNKIVDALYVAAPDDIEFEEILELMKSAWDHWGSRNELLKVTDEQINEYVKRIC